MKELIDNKELVIALEELEKEKGIKKDYVIEAIEKYQKKFNFIMNLIKLKLMFMNHHIKIMHM